MPWEHLACSWSKMWLVTSMNLENTRSGTGCGLFNMQAGVPGTCGLVPVVKVGAGMHMIAGWD